MHHNSLLVRNLLWRYVLLACGVISLGLGILGLFLPLLPTTPFILLAAACFSRSSERFYRWITAHPRYGKMIADYLAGKGLPKKTKLLAISLLWLSIVFGCFVVDFVWARVAMLLTACAVSLYIWCLPTAEQMLPRE